MNEVIFVLGHCEIRGGPEGGVFVATAPKRADAAARLFRLEDVK